jgi:NAD-dependent deacetylase
VIRILPKDSVFILTGAGLSAESGIPTFRGSDGLWRKFRIEDVASPIAWRNDPQLVWEFYSWRREVAAQCRPNPAHFALAQLEQKSGEQLFHCTQNVDSLLEQAGCRNICHMHGRLMQSRCERDGCTQAPFDDSHSYPSLESVPRCECGGRIRPHICWFGEVPYHLETIAAALDRCTIFICIGSSGVVHPAAGFAAQVKSQPGTRSYYVGPEEPANSRFFDESFWGKAGEILPNLLAIES